MAQNPELLNNEEFEKVDHDQYQDENVTSTSMTGEMAEEDRYEGEADLLGDEYTSTAGQPTAYQQEAEADPLISFDTSPPPVSIPPPEPAVSEPPPAPSKSVSESEFSTGGAWLENVDPRDEVISGSAKDADNSQDIMASPENLPDSSSEANASCGVIAEREFDDDVRDANEQDSGSESDSSMSLDGSGESSGTDNESSDSESELSASEMDEKNAGERKKITKNKIGEYNFPDEQEGAFAASENINGADGYAYTTDESNLNTCVETQEDSTENASNSNVRSYTLEENANNYLFDEDKGQNFKPDLSSCKENIDVIDNNACETQLPSLVEKYTGADELGRQNNQSADGNNCFPYCDDINEGNSGSGEPLEKQLEASWLQEERSSVSNLSDNFSPATVSSEKTDSLYKEGDSLYSVDTGFEDTLDSDMMERALKLGILKSDLRVTEDMIAGSDHNSDADRASNHSEELHVHFKDEVVIMEFSDEEKEEPKSDIVADFVERTLPEADVVEKDTVENMGNKENSNLESDNAEAPAGTSELDFSFYRIPKGKDNNSDEYTEILQQKMEQDQSDEGVSAVSAEVIEAFADKDHTLIPVSTDNYEERKLTDTNTKEDELAVIDAEVSVNSQSDSEDNSSGEEVDDSGSDSSGEANISGEWNVSPLCDIENTDLENKYRADIPETLEESEGAVESNDICLLSYSPIGEDMHMKEYERQDTLEIKEIESPSLLGSLSKEDSNESVPEDEQISDSVSQEIQEMNSEQDDALHIEEQLKEVEKHLIARLISETDSNPDLPNEFASDDLETQNLQEVCNDNTVGSEAVLLGDNTECKEYDDQVQDIDMKKHISGEVVARLPIDVDKELESRPVANDEASQLIQEYTELMQEYSSEPTDSNKDIFDNHVIMPQSEVLVSDAYKLVEADKPVAEDALNHNMIQDTPLDMNKAPEVDTKINEQCPVNDIKSETKSFKILSVESQALRPEPEVTAPEITSECIKGKMEETEKALEKTLPEAAVEAGDGLNADSFTSKTENSLDIGSGPEVSLADELLENSNSKQKEEYLANDELLLDKPGVSPEPLDSVHSGPEISTTNDELLLLDSSCTGPEEVSTTDFNDMPSKETHPETETSARLVEIITKVVELIYWRDVKKTGIVFGSMMFILVSLACCTVMSVLAYLSLAVLTVTFSFRVYKSVMQAVQKTNEGHPFKKLMDLKIELKDEVVQEAAENIAKHLNNCTRELRRLYLVEDYVDSLKFGMLLWLLTYVGSWFSGMTLIILVVVSIFTLPRVYETYKVQIDTYINMARAQLNKILAQISAKIPFPKKKAKTQ